MEIKSTQERKKEILDAANELFITKGYDATSVTDIKKKVGVTKGNLYYHFTSKEEILDALIDRIGDNMAQRAMQATSNTKLPIPMRLARTILSLNVNTHGEGGIMETLHQPSNALFHQKSLKVVVERISPIIVSY